jgi:hypothetical protein
MPAQHPFSLTPNFTWVLEHGRGHQPSFSLTPNFSWVLSRRREQQPFLTVSTAFPLRTPLLKRGVNKNNAGTTPILINTQLQLGVETRPGAPTVFNGFHSHFGYAQ